MNGLPPFLCPTNTSSFAYKTIKDRLPVTITRAVDYICRFKNDLAVQYSVDSNSKEEVFEDIKQSIERLSQLRYELVTDKPIRSIQDDGSDAELWNVALKEMEDKIGKENSTWFKAPWLFTECYMYRRIREALLLSKTKLKDYDAFIESKREAYTSSEQTLIGLISGLCELRFNSDDDNKEEIMDLATLKAKHETVLLVSLWSNKNDLSLSSGQDNSSKVHNLIHQLDEHRKYLLDNQSDDIWSHIMSLKQHDGTRKRRLDLILDNTGMEFIADLIYSDFLLRNNLFDEINLHAKCYSWFVSDVTPEDFEFVIKKLQRVNSVYVNQFLTRLNNYQEEKRLNFRTHPFWTLSYSHHDLKRIYPELYTELCNSDLVILKGDLNYRKLLSDLDWPHDTQLKIAIRDFYPTSLAALRTLKSDLVVDLDLTDPYLKSIKENDKNWMINGDYGIIQFVKK